MNKYALVLFFITQWLMAQPAIDWQRTIGGASFDRLSVVKKISGGYLLGGTSQSNVSGDKSEDCLGISDFWILKTDESGNIVWQKTIGGSQGDLLTDISPTNDGGFIAGGSSRSDISGNKTENSRGQLDYWLVKVDASGTISWDKTIGGSLDDELKTVFEDQQGNFVISGISKSGISGEKNEACRGDFDAWLVKLSADGVLLWQKTLGGAAAELNVRLIATSDGGYALGSLSDSAISGDKTVSTGFLPPETWFVKLDSAGNVSWQKAYRLSGFNDIAECAASGYVIAGNSFDTIDRSLSFQFEATVLKVDESGEPVWNYEAFTASGDCNAVRVAESTDGSIYFMSNADFPTTAVVTKLSESGSLIWNRPFNTPVGDDVAQSLLVDNNAIVAGLMSDAGISGDKTDESRGGNDYWIVKFVPETLGLEAAPMQNWSVLPNPVGGDLTIVGPDTEASVAIYAISGQLLRELPLSGVENTFDFPYPSGLYLLTVKNADGGVETIKIAKQ